MRILLTNDDGIVAPGLEVLARNVARWIDEGPAGEVREAIVVAPSVNHSGMSSAVGDVFSHPNVKYERSPSPAPSHSSRTPSRLPRPCARSSARSAASSSSPT